MPGNDGPNWVRWTYASAARSPTSPQNYPTATPMPLMRLRYGGSAARWGFAIYLASKDGYEDSYLPTGDTARDAEEALDVACALYLD